VIELVVRDIGAQFEQFSGYPVRIEIFEGPLDLLLHLVQREEIEAAEVDIVHITDGFLAFLRTMAQINIHVAGEFVETAASLLLLKSRALLPREELPDDEVIEEGTTVVELARRLAEYRTYKEAATILAEAKEARKQIYLRPLKGDEAIGAGVVPLQDVSIFDIVSAVQEMLDRAKEPAPHLLMREEISVSDRIDQIHAQLRAGVQRRMWFHELVHEGATRAYIIVTFLAVLEMIRRGELLVSQERPRGYIQLDFVQPEEATRP